MKFPPAQIKHRDRRGRNDGKDVEPDDDRPRFDFSYSGIKTAILRYVEAHEMRDCGGSAPQSFSRVSPSRSSKIISPIATSARSIWSHRSSAQLSKIWWERLWQPREAYDVATLFVTGGVAANQELRQTFEREGAKQGLPVYFPSRPLSTDNAAMIAAAAYPKFLATISHQHGFFCRGGACSYVAQTIARTIQISASFVCSSMFMSLNSLDSKISPHSLHSTNSESSSRLTICTRGCLQGCFMSTL